MTGKEAEAAGRRWYKEVTAERPDYSAALQLQREVEATYYPIQTNLEELQRVAGELRREITQRDVRGFYYLALLELSEVVPPGTWARCLQAAKSQVR